MFDFQKLEVYQKSKSFYIETRVMISETKLDNFIRDQLSRAAFSVPLNIAEGSGKFSKADRKNYYTTARASVYECVAIFDLLNDEKRISQSFCQIQFNKANEISRMLFTMIQSLNA
ncbi:MAG: hypothetical protein RLZZ60_1295 [Bacteroidota bacterium]|jgi:four helix bundle protein